MTSDYYTTKEFAKIFGTTERTIRKAIREGKIRAFKINDTRREPYKIHKSEVYRLENKVFEDLGEKNDADH